MVNPAFSRLASLVDVEAVGARVGAMQQAERLAAEGAARLSDEAAAALRHGQVVKSSRSIRDILAAIPAKIEASSVIQDASGMRIVRKTIDRSSIEAIINSAEHRTFNAVIESQMDRVPNIRVGASEARFTDTKKLLEAEENAIKYYENVRQASFDIEIISRNTGLKREWIEKIKDHLFNQKHILDDVRYLKRIAQFDVDPEIAFAWERLINGNMVQSDLVLLQHEFLEAAIVNGLEFEYDSVHHHVVNKIYPWNKLL